MQGYRNIIIVLSTLACQTFLAFNAITYGSDLAAFMGVLGAIGATAVGGVYGRGYNKAKSNGHGKAE